MKIKLNEEQATNWKLKHANALGSHNSADSKEINDYFGINYDAELEINEETGRQILRTETSIKGWGLLVPIAYTIIFVAYLVIFIYNLLYKDVSIAQNIVIFMVVLPFMLLMFKIFTIDGIKQVIKRRQQRQYNKEHNIEISKPKITFGSVLMQLAVFTFVSFMIFGLVSLGLQELGRPIPADITKTTITSMFIVFGVSIVLMIILGIGISIKMWIKLLFGGKEDINETDSVSKR